MNNYLAVNFVQHRVHKFAGELQLGIKLAYVTLPQH